MNYPISSLKNVVFFIIDIFDDGIEKFCLIGKGRCVTFG